jgi:hypothetical protein
VPPLDPPLSAPEPPADGRVVTPHPALRPHAIPAELRLLPRWACWKEEPKPGPDKPGKPPIRAHDWSGTHVYARCDDSSTWSTFAEALAYRKLHLPDDGPASGVSFCLNGDGIVGIDLDDCRDPKTNAIKDWAVKIIRRFGSYTEVSPSGTGIRIFLRGTLPPEGRHKGKVEVYDTGKFLSVTGHKLTTHGAGDGIEDRAAELLAWHAEVFGDGTGPTPTEPTKKKHEGPRLIIPQGNPFEDTRDERLYYLFRDKPKAAELYRGERNGYASQSEVDLALANMAVNVGWGDQDLVDLLVMARRNADEPIKPLGYFIRTVEKARDGPAVPTPRAKPQPPPSPGPAPSGPVIVSTPKEDLPELAREPDLARAVRRDLAAVGLVGEEDNGQLVYLIYLTRLLDDPGAVITRGRSGAGKSTLLKRVAVLVPDAAKVEAMAMTPASWFNTEPDYFRHKLFLAGERKHSTDDATKDAGALLRQLLSEKRINRCVSIWEPETKSWQTVNVERRGPIAYAESTTAGSIFEEDLNRMLQVYVDESAEQNRRVVKAIGSKYDPNRPGLDVEAVVRRHHEFQQYLQALPTPDVRIPYWEVLCDRLPTSRVESRRVAQQVFTVIEGVVLLNRHRRRAPDGRLLATLNDYALARRLLLGPLHAALGAGKDYKDFLRLRAGVRKDVFTAADVKQALGFDNDMGPSRLLRGLVEAGLVVLLTVQKGRTPATYRWAGKDGPDPEAMVLPPVEEVRGF